MTTPNHPEPSATELAGHLQQMLDMPWDAPEPVSVSMRWREIEKAEMAFTTAPPEIKTSKRDRKPTAALKFE